MVEESFPHGSPESDSRPDPSSRHEDPPPFTVLNPDGPAPLVLMCDHASRAVPAAYGNLGVDEAALWRHIAWDIGAADVTERLAALLDAPAVLAGYSRLLVDCNRAVDSPTSMPPESDGVPVPANRDIDADERAFRIANYFTPYHDAAERVIAAKRATGHVPAILSIHSFTPVMNGFERPWHVGLLWHQDDRLFTPLHAYFRRMHGIVVGDNKPYHAHSPHGYSMAAHSEQTGLPHILFEIRQDLIDTHHGAENWANILADAITHAVAEAGPFDIKVYSR